MSWGKTNNNKKEDKETVPKKKLLFMDDDEILTKFISRALTRLGYEVIIAHDGNKAMGKA